MEKINLRRFKEGAGIDNGWFNVSFAWLWCVVCEIVWGVQFLCFQRVLIFQGTFGVFRLAGILMP